jgi:tetratricopeptide (TPR) repeat protein
VELSQAYNKENLTAAQKTEIKMAEATLRLAEKKYSDVLALVQESDVQAAAQYAARLVKLRADAYYGQHNWQEALSNYEQALKIDESQWQSMARRGSCSLMLGKDSDAISHLTKFIDWTATHQVDGELIHGFIIAAHNNRGNAFFAQGQYDKAQQDYAAAIDKMRQHPQQFVSKQYEIATVYANRAHTYYQMGKIDKGDEDIKEVDRLMGASKAQVQGRPEVEELVAWMETLKQKPQVVPGHSQPKHPRGCFNCHPG